ncbi:MAG: glycosyltransferase family A protein [Bacteroidota bacterium]
MPFASIILPTHNRAGRLPTAIESVLAQTFSDWELIIVDDGSTDDTRAVVTRYADSRIRYHYQENRQLNGARNAGVGLAGTPWIGFLDDDDEFLPDHLELLHAAMERDGFNHQLYRSGILLRGGNKTTKGVNYVNEEDILPQFWDHPTGMFGMLLATELMLRHPFDEAHLLLDDFLWLVPVLRDHPLYQINAHTAVVNLHPEQRSATYLDKKRLYQNVTRLAEAYNLLGVPLQVPFATYQRQALHQYMHFCRQLTRNGQRWNALLFWRQGLKYAELRDYSDVGKTLAKILLG